MATQLTLHYTFDVIGITMTYRDLPYYEGMRAKTHCKNKLHENKKENHPVHTFRKCSITWSQFVVFTSNQCWLIRHQWYLLPYIAYMILKSLKWQTKPGFRGDKETSRHFSLLHTK